MSALQGVLGELRRQRWDDHRYYHQSRINQSLHLVSAVSFLCAYALLLVDPLAAVLVGWCVGMVTRQTGHYVFEPARFDAINQITNTHKEAVKVGFNQKRKTILIAMIVLSPSILAVDSTLFGLLKRPASFRELADNVAIIWLVVAAAGVTLRCLQLCITRSVRTGLVWVLKISTDPFHNIRIYWKSPLYLLRGQLYDPLDEATHSGAAVPRSG